MMEDKAMRKRSEEEQDELAWRIVLVCFLISLLAQLGKLVIGVIG